MKQHTVKKGETLGSISALYYLNASLYLKIYNANPFLKGRSTGDLANEDLIYPGEQLIIPDVSTFGAGDVLSADTKVSIEIEGEIFEGWSGVTIDLNLDTIADSFSIAVPFKNVPPYSTKFRKFGYQNVRIFFNGDLILTGILTRINITSGDESNVIKAQGYSYPGVLSKVNLAPSQYPRKFDGLSLAQIAQQLCEPFGFGVQISSSAGEQANIIYDETGIGETQKIGTYLTKLARDRSCILGNTASGDLLIDRIVQGQDSILDIRKPNNPERKNDIVYDGDKLFSDFFLVSTGDETEDAETSVFKFPIKSFRPVVLTQSNKSKQNNGNRIENEAKKALADAQVFTSSIPTWFNNKKKIIKPGQLYTLVDSSIQVPQSERHIIKTVTLTSAASGGRQAAFTGILEAAAVAA